MLSQTFSSRYFESTISLNGRLVRLGSFNDILNYNRKNKENDADIDVDIEMSFTEEDIYTEIRKVNLGFKFSGKKDQNKRLEDDFHPEITEGTISVEKTDSSIESIKFSKKSPTDELYSVLSFESKNKDEINKEFPDYKIEGVTKQDLVPHAIQVNYDYTKKISSNFVNFLIGSPAYLKNIGAQEAREIQSTPIPRAVLDKIRNLIEKEHEERAKNFEIPEELTKLINKEQNVDIERIRRLLAKQSLVLTPEIIPRPESDEYESIEMTSWRDALEVLDEKVKKSLFDFLVRHRDIIQGTWYSNMKKQRKKDKFTIRGLLELNYFLGFIFNRKIKYLGPLRNEPQAMYQAFDLSELDVVGLKGEYTAAVLHINKSRRIKYPKITSIEGQTLAFENVTDTLAKACTEWLTYLGVVTEVQTYDKGKLGYELQVKTSASDHLQDLTHVGVGVSQILPIVVMALLSEDNDVLIFEQPELHLHPKVQSRLCDFLLAVSSGSKQCIIETHSEYIINRLRRRIAQSRDHSTKEKSSVLFIEKEAGATVFRQININTFGAIIDWPKDFFDQTDEETENILLEATLKKNHMRNSEAPK